MTKSFECSLLSTWEIHQVSPQQKLRARKAGSDMSRRGPTHINKKVTGSSKSFTRRRDRGYMMVDHIEYD